MRDTVRGLSPLDLAFGFVAAAVAVLTVHQGIVHVLGLYKMLPPTSIAWSTKPFGPLGIPTILNSVFWGGLWGVLFAAVWPKLPGATMWLKGMIFGLIVAVVSNWMLVPFIKGTLFKVPNQTFFANLDPTRMAITLLIVGGFGTVLGLVFGLLRRR